MPKSVRQSVLSAGAAREQHVAGLDVAVNQTVPVRFLERAGDLTRDRRGASRFEPFLLIEQSAQIDAVDVAHGQVQQPGLLAGVEDLNYVGVIQSGGQAALPFEPRSVGGFSATSGAITFRATVRFSTRSLARYTSPIPPRPTSASIR